MSKYANILFQIRSICMPCASVVKSNKGRYNQAYLHLGFFVFKFSQVEFIYFDNEVKA